MFQLCSTFGTSAEQHFLHDPSPKKLLFRKVFSPQKVPVMQKGDVSPGINESLVCMELIDEISGGKLMGSDPFSRAQLRLDAAKFDAEIVNCWYGYLMGKFEPKISKKYNVIDQFNELAGNRLELD